MTDLNKLISQNVPKIMEDRDISQRDMALATGIHQSQISKMLLNQRRWDADKIEAVCKFLDVSYTDIITGNAPEPVLPPTEMVERAIQQAEESSLREDIQPKRTKLFKMLMDDYVRHGLKPTVDAIRKMLPFLLVVPNLIVCGGYGFL